MSFIYRSRIAAVSHESKMLTVYFRDGRLESDEEERRSAVVRRKVGVGRLTGLWCGVVVVIHIFASVLLEWKTTER